ncbi:MAG: class I SAM-dependent methyltransferase [Woeseiaceae bacterium]
MNRRDCIAALGALLAIPPAARLLASEAVGSDNVTGNFGYVYSNPELRRQFLDFLTNVFHLYPENDFHEVLTRLSQPGAADESVYIELQQELAEIQPFLGALRYAIPALRKQKAIMADQTVMLLDASARYDGHLEIGSTGRYVGTLKDRLDIAGDIFLLHTQKSGFGPEDIVERGQLARIGEHIDLGDYSSEFANVIPRNSLDLATVYIGFHHCPIDKREEFISSVREVIRPGGQLILRDHDVHNEDLRRIAALAHDTFNAGINESWDFNQKELRNFYSLRFIIDYLEGLGFKHCRQLYFQRGDPTRNALTAFTKI